VAGTLAGVRRRWALGWPLALVLVGLVLPLPVRGAGASGPPTPTYRVDNPVAPRLQWDANHGYCGEVAFISAGLSFGQYLSQYDARALASPGTPQYEASAQLLLGENDTAAARRMHLTYATWEPRPGSTSRSFLAWVKGEVVRGFPVAVGVYENQRRFGLDTAPGAGDPNYDHIVLVTGVRSAFPLTLPAVYHPGDVLTFSDHGLWTGTPSGRPQYVFSYPFGSFQADRRQANRRTAAVYSLPDTVADFGIALTGVDDPDHETVPVRLAASRNHEVPPISPGSNRRPAPMPLELTVTVSGLRPGTAYDLYRYDTMTSVPDVAFNAHASAASHHWAFTASGPTYTVTQAIVSSDQVIYRAVPASGP
jgi:hypothetical protein